MPAVSVIVPAFNACSQLPACVDSLLSQTLPNIEIILVDDGSTDGTSALINSYAAGHPGRITAIHRENGGVAAARNAGLDAARGEYIGFADADDRVDPRMFEKLYARAAATDADIVHCWRYTVGKSGPVAKPKAPVASLDGIRGNPAIISNQSMFVWDKLFRRAKVQAACLRFRNLGYAEDFLFAYEFQLHAGVVAEVREPLYYYSPRQAGSASAAYDNRLLDMAQALRIANGLAQEAGLFPLLKPYLWELESKGYVRRIDDFPRYSDAGLQCRIAQAYFQLFDDYFPGWEREIRATKAAGGIERALNAYRSSWPLMRCYVSLPRLLKRGLRKAKREVAALAANSTASSRNNAILMRN